MLYRDNYINDYHLVDGRYMEPREVELEEARYMKERKGIRKGLVFGIILALVAVVFAGIPMNVSAYTGNVFIMADGSFLPSTAPLVRNGDTYTLTDDIAGTIYIYKPGITLDGAGYKLDGAGIPAHIYVYGGYGAKDLTVKNFNIVGGNIGILLHQTSGNTIEGNTILDSKYNGIKIDKSSYNTITGNTISGCKQCGIYMSSSSDNTLNNNIVSGSVYDGVFLYGSNSNTLYSNTVKENWNGIYLTGYSKTNTITLNLLTSNKIGLYLYQSSYNLVTSNTMSYNSLYGIMLYKTDYNTFYYNNIHHNYNLVLINSNFNKFDNGAGEGNYWGDSYKGVDINGDGIGDTNLPHLDVDYYPLMEPWSPNEPPVADAGENQVVECQCPLGAEVILDGSGSSDPDEDELTYSWIWDGGSATGVSPTVTFPLGTTTVTLVVNDGTVDSVPDTVDITVQDTTPPEITVADEPIVLWPPNHNYHEIETDDFVTSVSDICDGEVGKDDVVITSVSSDEPEDVEGNGDGNTEDDIVIMDSQTVKLRAERQGKGNGRVYTINFAVTDGSENTATGSYQVWVPHDEKDDATDNGAGGGYTVYA